ncbi:MAG: PAS domain S-box protein [Methanomicrobium sp.]|nr:PAS domain S-box protein [Methanomicrobium sp.]
MTDNFVFEEVNPAKILIVDAEVMSAMGLESSLKRMGYEVLKIAVTGKDAVDVAGREKPDIILMDINLQDEMEGIYAADIINQTLNIPILFLTANYQENILKRALKSNPYGYLNKPVRSVELKTAIETALNKHRMTEAEKKFFASEKNHRNLFEKIAQGVMYISSEMDIVDANPAVFKITGLRPEEIIGKDFLWLMNNTIKEDGSVYPYSSNPVIRAFKTGKTACDTFGFFNREECGYRFVIATAMNMDLHEELNEKEESEDNKTGRMQAKPENKFNRKYSKVALTLEDITEIKNADERFFKFFEMLSVPVAVVDLQKRDMIDANPVFLNILGYTREDIIGKPLSVVKIFADENEKRAFYDAIQNNGSLKNMPVKALTSSGKIRHGFLSAEIITIGKSPQVLVSFIDDRENFHVF